MAGFSEEKVFGMTVRESANDGSDFTNPDADYRRLFLGEDGILRLKDSAGTVTDIGASGSVATDAIWDAAGDLAVGSGANTAARLAIGANGTLLGSDGTTASWVGSAWTSYTPTLTATVTNPTLGNGTLVGRYRLIDAKACLVRISFTFGSTSTAGSGSWRFALPFTTVAALGEQILPGVLTDSGTGYYLVGARAPANSAVSSDIVVTNASTTTQITHNAPFTWATSDSLVLTGLLELA